MFLPRISAAALCLSLSLAAHAIPTPQNNVAAAADAKAAAISDAAAFVKELDFTMKLAREGLYGEIKEADMDRLNEAHDTITILLDGQETAMDLPPDDRIELYNAQELITSIIRNDDKNRRVCMRVKTTGSRITKRECMSVAEREQRAKAARDAAGEMLRVDCVPGETSTCGVIR